MYLKSQKKILFTCWLKKNKQAKTVHNYEHYSIPPFWMYFSGTFAATFSHLFYLLLISFLQYLGMWTARPLKRSLYPLVYDDNRTHTWLSALALSAIKCPREDNKHPRTRKRFLHKQLLLARVNMHEPAQSDMHRWSICSSVLVSFRLVWHSATWLF